MKKYLNKVKIVEHSDSIISEIPILTVALFWPSTCSSQNRDLDIIESQCSTIFILFKYFFHDPYFKFFNLFCL